MPMRKVQPSVGGQESPQGLRGLQEPVLEHPAWGETARPAKGAIRATYRAWWNMLDRCRNENNSSYENYGGRGIKVCDRWQAYELFLIDMGIRPRGDLSLDRIDSNGHYEPANCRWATREQQHSNQRRHGRIPVLIAFDGKEMTMEQWSKHLGMSYNTIYGRWTRRLPPDEIFAKPGTLQRGRPPKA